MSDRPADNSLASQAAAWVPPWARDPEPAPSPEPDERAEPEPEPIPQPQPEEDAAPDRAPVGAPDPEVAGLAAAEEPAVAVDEAAVDEAAEGAAPAAAVDGAAEDDGVRLAPAGLDAESTDPDGQGALFALPPGAGPSTSELRATLEAILLVVDEPVAEPLLAQVLDQPLGRIGAVLAGLADEYQAQQRGFDLRRAAGGWRLYTNPRYAAAVERFVLDGQSVRLTQAALETLAVVAYKQPVTRSQVSAIRGVNCDGVVRTLVTRGLIEECGTEPESGAHLYRTTSLFLEKLGLDSVDQLPPLAPFLPDNVDEIADAQP